MSSAFLDLTGLSRFLDHLKLLLVQSDWQKTDSTDMAFIKNKPTVSVDEQTLVLTGWGSGSAIETFTVRFMLNDGTETVYDSQTVDSGSTVSVPSDPTRTDYDFGGWYTDSSCTTAFDSNTAITRNTDLYAKWTAQSSGETCTITFAPQNPENQRWDIWSSDSSFQMNYSTMTATINQGATIRIGLDGTQGYTGGNVIVDGTSMDVSTYNLTVSKSSYAVTAGTASKILVNLGNYSGQMTIGLKGNATSKYNGVIGYSPAGYGAKIGDLSSTTWGDFTITNLCIAYGSFEFGLSGTNESYAESCVTGTLTIGTCSVTLSNGELWNADALWEYLAEHVGETLDVSINLTALEGYTKTILTLGRSTYDNDTRSGFVSPNSMLSLFYSSFGSLNPSSINGTAITDLVTVNTDTDITISPSSIVVKLSDGSDLSADADLRKTLAQKFAAASVGDTFILYAKAGS